MSGEWVHGGRLDRSEWLVLLRARRLQQEGNILGSLVRRSVTDTSAAARRRLSPYEES